MPLNDITGMQTKAEADAAEKKRALRAEIDAAAQQLGIGRGGAASQAGYPMLPTVPPPPPPRQSQGGYPVLPPTAPTPSAGPMVPTVAPGGAAQQAMPPSAPLPPRQSDLAPPPRQQLSPVVRDLLAKILQSQR